jgi:hypothetical protein
MMPVPPTPVEERTMSNISEIAIALVASSILALGLAACVKEGPVERAGKEVDKAVESAGKKIEAAGEKVQEVAKDAKK